MDGTSTAGPAAAAAPASSIDPRLKAPSTVVYRGPSETRAPMSQIMYQPARFSGELVTPDDVDVEAGAKPASSGKLGWMDGVMIPVLLNIWGVIMFLRLGWVAGQAGVLLGSVIIIASNIVTLITALSMCAISTNGEVEGGGAYYLISRALGASYGGAIGLLFFIAQAVATSMYVVGFAESVVDIIKRNGGEPFTGSWDWDLRVIGLVTLFVLLCVALVGVGWYAKCQIFLLIFLVIAMTSVVLGAFFPKVPDEAENAAAGFVGYGGIKNMEPEFITDVKTKIDNSFFTVFAVFFPAVTGIMAGANMSGDLEDPSVAIPKGTLYGIALTWVTYLGLLWIVGNVAVRCVGAECDASDYGSPAWARRVGDDAPEGGLVYNKLIMAQISLWEPLVYIGVFAATLSSALASIVGAPRILQAVAKDEVFDFKAVNFFAQGVGPDMEPRRGYFLTWVIAMGCVLIGELDLIAPLISNFFMISYAMTNYACFAASMSKAPGWRPSFKYYNKWLSLFGSLLCIVVMFAFDWANSLVSVVVGVGIFQYLELRGVERDWGAASNARKYVSAVTAMQKLAQVQADASGKSHVKEYRPQFLVLSGPPSLRPGLVKFATALYKGGGVQFFCDVLMDKQPKPNDGQLVPQEPGIAGHAEPGIAGAGAVAQPEPEPLERETTASVRQLCNVARDSGLLYLRDHAQVGEGGHKLSFMEAVRAKSVRAGFKAFVQLGGMGGLRPNIVVVGYKERWMKQPAEEVDQYERLLNDVVHNGMGLVVVRDQGFFEKSPLERSISARISSRQSRSRAAPQAVRGAARPSGPRMDVWFLYDDGGLSLLLPHLLRLSKGFEGWTIRVPVVREHDDSTEEEVEAGKQRMRHLLSKFRIDARVVDVNWPVTAVPNEQTQRWYTGAFPELPAPAVHDQDVAKPGAVPPIAEDGGEGEEDGGSDGSASAEAGTAAAAESKRPDADDSDAPPTPAEIKSMQEQTRRYLRLGEIIRAVSKDSQAVFITMPLAHPKMPRRLYMSWLESVSRNLPSTIFVLGNNSPVMTFLA